MNSRYLPLIVYIGLTIAGIIVRYTYILQNSLWDAWSAFDTASGVALAILAAMAYRDMIRDEDEIDLLFDVDMKRQIKTGLCLLRKDCTRGEVIGALEMLQRKTEKPFHYDARLLHELLNRINKIQKGKDTHLLIPIDSEEFEQFVLPLPDKNV